ncbi:putative enterotoxin [Ophiocordyceps australis]|uniref:Putative enterotoxin n=1 Tax=Ophiocordyceps australis TaxID=1399860 RepID=A0A2C5XHK7_9HYPO|nr:putative enterotoxin [Ophiocordyceps australis]
MASTTRGLGLQTCILVLVFAIWAPSCTAGRIPSIDARNNQVSSRAERIYPNYVFRGDKRHPMVVKDAGGFSPNSAFPPLSPWAWGIWNHVLNIVVNPSSGRRSTVYVSATTSFGVAAEYATNQSVDGGWVYDISAAPNMVDVQGTLMNYTPRPEDEEYVALGGIYWSQVAGWMYLPGNYSGYEWMDSTREFVALSDRYVRNPDFWKYWDAQTVSPGQPQLAGFYGEAAPLGQLLPWKLYPLERAGTLPDYALEFVSGLGNAVNWSGSFPLV